MDCTLKAHNSPVLHIISFSNLINIKSSRLFPVDQLLIERTVINLILIKFVSFFSRYSDIDDILLCNITGGQLNENGCCQTFFVFGGWTDDYI